MELREFRESRKLSQGDAAKEIGISAPALCQYEQGNRWPEIDMMAKIVRWSTDRKTKIAAVTPNDLFAVWCRTHNVKYPKMTG